MISAMARLCCVALLAALTVFIPGCPSRTQLPDDPGISGEDFGLGLSIGMSAAEAEEQAASLTDRCTVEVVSRDDLIQREPYDTNDNTDDRVLVIYQDYSIADAADQDAGSNVVIEIRCYLADPDNSVVTLAGQHAAKLTEKESEQFFAQPVQRTATGDNEVHLTYYFAIEDHPREMLELVLSFHNGGYCFALALAAKPRVK